MNDVMLNKIATIERCLQRVKEEYAGDKTTLQNYTKQDSIVLNLQRAIEASIDIAMHIVAQEKWGLPQNSRDAFHLLHERRNYRRRVAWPAQCYDRIPQHCCS